MRHADVDTLSTVAATTASGSGSATVIVKPNPLASINGPASLQGGTTATGTVTLDLYSIEGDTVVLSYSDPSVTILSSVTVPRPRFAASPLPGGRGYYFLFKEQTFPVVTPAVSEAKTVMISATRAGVTKT